MEKTYEYYLEKNRILIYGVSGSEEIKTRIAAVYPVERLAEGENLYLKTRDSFKAQTKEKKEAVSATLAFNEKKDWTNEKLSKVRQAIRYFYKNDWATQQALLIEAEVPTDFASWTIFAESVFAAVLANADATAKMAILGHSAEQLQSYLEAAQEAEQLRLVAEKEDGEGQQATVTKLQNYSELMEYCTDLRECLGLFYTGAEAQKLEEVGIIVK